MIKAQPTACASYVQLVGGRRLTLSDTGPRDAIPVIYCHGAIGTPLQASVDLESLTARLHFRYIAINRPGIGGSDPAPGRTVTGFAADLEAVADALGVGRFLLAGVSAGGPYALAGARALSDRVPRVAVCSSLSPLCAPHRTPGMAIRIRLALASLTVAPAVWSALGDAVLPVIRRYPKLLHRVMSAHAAPAERERLHEPAEQTAAISSFLDATSYGVSGLVNDYGTYARGWGFEPGEVGAEVHIWHGAKDPLVPVEHALQLAVSLPRCRVFVDPDDGHHFFRRRLGDIVATLVDGTGADRPAGLQTAEEVER